MRRFALFRLVASLLAIAVFCLASLPAAAAREGTPGVPACASPPINTSPVRPGDAIPGWAGAPAAPDAAISSVLASAISVAAGGSHTCAVTSGGRVKCWGWNGYGQLGDGTTTDRLTPVDVSGLASGVIGVAAGRYHTCAVTAGGGVKCWGSNGRGQLGDGTTTDRLTPVDVSGLGSGVSALAAGAEHTCAVTAGGAVKCWGWNGYGQLGDGTTIGRATPVDVNGLGSGVSVVAAGRYHTCVMTAGGVKCWGGNSNGQLGDGTTQSRTTPVDVSGLGSGVTAVAGGESHTCAVMDAVHGGGVKCWGYNRYGQLGDGTTTDRLVPVDVSGLGNGASAVAAGKYHSCAVKAEGGVKCWGFNIYGQLGDGTAGDRNVPTDVSGLASGVSGVAAGGDHTCAVMDTVRGGGLKCWGNNGSGQLGDGTTDKHTTPVEVSGLGSGVNVVAAGGSHTCAVTNGGGLKCWGLNVVGQLGDGTTTGHATPVDVSGLGSGVSAVAAGEFHTCAVTAGGGVKCWGQNYAGELGNGTTTNQTTPVDVSGLGIGVTAVAAGGSHTCALTGGGGVKCWGNNDFGQLGDGTTSSRSVPVDVSWAGERGERRGGRRVPHLCGDGRRRGQVLGRQRGWPVGGRHDVPPQRPGGRERAGERGDRRGGRRVPHLCGDGRSPRRRGQVLGVERRRPVRGRHDDQASHPGGCERACERGEQRLGR